MEDKDIEDLLKKLGKTDSDYPRDKFTATRAELVTEIRTMRRDKRAAKIRKVIIWILAVISCLVCLFSDKIVEFFR